VVTRAQRRLLSRDGQLRRVTRGQLPRRASPDGRRSGKVKGTSGAAGLQGVRALRSLAALKRQAALRRCQPGDLILVRERPTTVWPSVWRFQAMQESGSDKKCPGEPLGGKSSTPRWRLGRCSQPCGCRRRPQSDEARPVGFLRDAHRLDAAAASAGAAQRVFNTSRLCSGFQLVAEAARHLVALQLPVNNWSGGAV